MTEEQFNQLTLQLQEIIDNQRTFEEEKDLQMDVYNTIKSIEQLEEQKKLEEEQQKKLEEEQKIAEQKKLEEEQALAEQGEEEIVYEQIQLVNGAGELVHTKNWTEGLYIQGFIILFLLTVILFRKRR